MYTILCVALRKESVDRNSAATVVSVRLVVALRKESVDRNGNGNVVIRLALLSLSARRAWIEILNYTNLSALSGVALRKESVDRN